jgi:acyl-CoA dehydrogenase
VTSRTDADRPDRLNRLDGLDGLDGLDDVVAVARAHAAAVDREAVFPHESLLALRSSGLMGMFVPVEHGGLGRSLHTYVTIAQALAAGCLSTALIWVMHAFQVDAVARFGPDELRGELLPRIAAGKVYVASVTTETGRGSDLFTAAAPLTPDPDRPGRLRFERAAPVVSGGRHADAFLITLRAGVEAAAQDVTLVYAERGDVEIAEHLDWDPTGMRGTESVGLELAGSVPAGNVVGEPGRFRTIAWDSMVPLSHIGWAACWLGAARGTYAELLRWLRSPDRRGGPDIGSELVRERLGRIRVDLDLVSAYLTGVCDEVEAVWDAGGSLAGPRAQLRLNSLKLASSELTFGAADAMVQLAGLGGGYSRSAPIPFERCFRDLRAARLNHSNDRLWPATGGLALLDRSVTLL